MTTQVKFLCSLWQGKHGVDVYSSTDRLLPSLKSEDLVPFIPGYDCKLRPANTGHKVCYYEQEKFSLTCSADNKSNVVTGDFETIRDGEVIPYLACALLEIQRQAVGETSAHTAAVSLNGQGVLLMGKEGSGKTSMALHLCREYGYKLVANDIAIIGFDEGQAFIYEGAKFFWLRLDPIKKHHPDLVKFFTSASNKDPWTNRTIVHPHQIGVEIETKTVPIAAAFFLHIDKSAKKLHIERSLNRWPRLYLYENFSRYIRRTCSPMMGGKDFHYLSYLPSLDTPDFHASRVKLIDYLIEDLGIDYVAGRLREVGSIINKAIPNHERSSKMVNTNNKKSGQTDVWKDWHRTKEGTVDEDIPKLAEEFKQHGISKILDLGCGTGRHTVFFAEKGFEVFGFDFFEETVNRAKEILQRLNLRANLRIWDMANPFPYDDEFFDAVISTRVFHHSKMKTIRQIIAEIKRVLRKGGYVYIQVPMMERVQKYIRQGGKFDEIEPGTFVPLEGREKGVPHHNFTREELVGLFDDFEIKSLTERDEHYNLLATKPSPRVNQP